MKSLAFVSLLLAVAPVFADEGASTPTLSERGTQIYGEAMPLGRPLGIGDALTQPGEWRQRRGKFEGRVTQVCQAKGCWLVLADGDRYARVFGGHSFFLPKETTGRAIVYGQLSERTIPETFAKHLAKDAGRDPATVVGDQVEYRIDATSVELLPAS